jgi:hypothetical protein
MKEITIVIPTYWTWPTVDRTGLDVASYDHPTPLGGDSTLPRLLDDLCMQRFKSFNVMILTGLSHPDLGQAVSAHMSQLLAPYRSRLDIFSFDGPAWTRLKSVMENEMLPTIGFHLGSYSGIRNLQLLIPHVWGAKVIIALDDDERVEPDYLDKALVHIGKNVNSHRVLGLAGPYLQADGSAYLNLPALSGNIFVDKGYYINKAMSGLMSAKESPVMSPLALGGNMIFHHDCFTRVPFDPGITRGEDIDYLINARLHGIEWWFDANLTILHLPPKHYETPLYRRMREDVFRFIYEQEKLHLFGFNEPAWLEPYPGAFLKENLIQQARAALESERTPDLAALLGEPEEIIEQAKIHAMRHVQSYKPFVQAWGQMMDRIEQETSLRRALSQAL